MRILLKASRLLAAMMLFASNLPVGAQSNSDTFTDLPLVDPTNVPPFATFYSLSTFGMYFENSFGPPVPWNFCPECAVYYMGSNASFGSFSTNAFVVDDTLLTQGALTQMETQDPPPVPPGGGDGGDPGVPTPLDAYSYPSNYLWLSIESASNGVASVTAHGTVPDQTYELLSRERLSDTNWYSEGTFLGAENQNWTLTTVAVGARTNQLFIWARSWADDGSGLPIWWQLQYFGRTGVDPYADPDGDGWLNIQEFQNNTNPTVPNQPPAPAGLAVAYQNGTTSAKVTWNASQGPLLYYVLERTVWDLQQTNYTQVAAGTTLLNDTLPLSNPSHFSDGAIYRIKAHYAVADSPWSPPAALYRQYSPFIDGYDTESAWVTLGQQNHIYLATPPPRFRGGTGNLIGYYYDWSTVTQTVTNWTFSTDALTNGPCQIPDFMIPTLTSYVFEWYLDLMNSNGTRVASIEVQVPDSDGFSYWFFDAREQLQQNLAFWLRASPSYQPFTFRYPQAGIGVYPAAYLYSSFYQPYEFDSGFGGDLNAFTPYDLNYTFRNFAFDQSLVDGEGNPTTGAQGNFDNMWINGNGTYEFEPPTNFLSISALLSPSQSQWIYHPFFQSYHDGIGCQDTGTNTVTLLDNATNFFGLQFLSAKIAYGANPATFTNLYPTGWLPWPPDPFNPAYSQTDQPSLSTVGYYFCQPGIHLMPGHTNFMTTNTTPPLIVGLGQPSRIAGYAKQAISNGDPTKFAYLGQYFEKAYKITTNGTVTSQETGVISPYGDFFPVEPGQVALATMTNFGVNERGTAVVNVVSLALDANHDGAINTSLTGPDFTSIRDPFVFWVNNDHDEPASGSNPDRDLNDWGNPPPVRPDYSYGQIRCQRNLEDFARLWVCGMPTLPADYTVQLGWSSISSGSPSIRLYWASETNGGIGYLTNATVAAQQIAQHNTPIGEISPTSTLTLPANVFSNGLTKYFLFEAGAVGSGQLTLTISQGGTNTVAQTSASFDFHDIVNLYEQVIVTNVLMNWPDMVQTNLTSGFRVVSHAAVNPGEAKQLAVFVHGWRVSLFDWYNSSETMLKRLYWQGYQGRFAALRWPTRSQDSELFPQMGYITYNRSEHIAFKSGTAAAAYLNDLRNRFPDYTISGCSHSMGGIVAMQTLKELASASQQPLNNWVLMQAAVPAQCFDPSVPNFQMFLDGEAFVPTPDVYRDYAAGITNALRPGGKIANFFNPDDFALWSWRFNEALYITNFLGYGLVTMKPNTFLGYYTDGTNCTLRTNDLNQSVLSIAYGGYYLNGPTRAVTNVLELMPFVARPRSLATGAQSDVRGQVQGLRLNLETELGFGAAEGDHSGQFNRNIQEPPIWPFYSQLRTNLFLPQ